MDKANESAFPNQPLGRDGLPEAQASFGLTKRETYAMHAMIGLKPSNYQSFDDLASDAVAMADALLKRLES